MSEPVVLSGSLTTSDKEKISYIHFKKGHEKVVIIAHGLFNSKEALLLLQLKDSLIDSYDIIMFDFRGHGKSSGFFSFTSKEDKDLEVILEYAKNGYESIGLIAFSLGAAISINTLVKVDTVKSFVCVSAPTEFGKIDFRFWNIDFENDVIYNINEGKIGKSLRLGPFWLNKSRPIDSIEKIKCPVLFIHGDKDWVIDYSHSHQLYDKAKSKKKIEIIPNGPHAEYLLRKYHKHTVSLIKDWLAQTL